MNRSRNTRSKVDQQVVPNDLVTEILERVPVKSLLRFKCVSKWWNDMIKSPIFAENHRLKHRSKMLLVMSCLQDNDMFTFHDLDSSELDEVRPHLSIPSSLKVQNSSLLGKYVNCIGGLWSKGIVCIMYDHSIALCNPAIREFKLLPSPPPLDNRETNNYGILARGFGITCTGEYKVIIIRELYTHINRKLTFHAHLYSSRTNSWKPIDNAPQNTWSHGTRDVLFFNGACHWYTIASGAYTVLSFNVKTEVFSRFGGLSGGNGYYTRLAIIYDCLAVVHHNGTLSSVFGVWVMKEYGIKDSWIKLFELRPQLHILPFSSWKNDEWLLIENKNDTPFGYNDKGTNQLACISFLTNEIKYYQVGVTHNVSPLLYEESLVSINNHHS